MSTTKDTAKTRLKKYLLNNRNMVVSSYGLAFVAGIKHYSRRLRELRSEGYPIQYLGYLYGSHRYILATNKKKSAAAIKTYKD